MVALKFVCKPYTSPYVIRLFDWFETHEGFLLIMEWPHGCITVEEFRKHLQGKKIPEDMARIIMWKLIKAANHCRKSGVVHCDIRAVNVLVNPETLELKLIDFGEVQMIKDGLINEFGN